MKYLRTSKYGRSFRYGAYLVVWWQDAEVPDEDVAALQASADYWGVALEVSDTPTEPDDGAPPAADPDLLPVTRGDVDNPASAFRQSLDPVLAATYARRGELGVARVPDPQLTTATLSGDVPTRTPGSYPAGYVELPYTTDKVAHGGAVVAPFTNSSFTSYRNTINSTGSISPWFIEFDYYGQDFSFRGRDNVGANAFLWMWVDGKPVTAAPENSGANAINLAFGVRFQWAAKELRRIRIYLRGTDFTALRLSPNDFVGATTITQPSIFWLGDSWLEGAFDVHTLNNFGVHASLALGMEHFQAGQGGTGYVVNGGGGTKAPFTDAARLAPIGAIQPDYVVVAGSINDDSSPPATITAAASSVYSQIAALAADARVIVIGPQSTGTAVSAGRAANRDAVEAAALAAPNVAGFIDPAGEGWIGGTGRIGATTGTGPADIFVQADGAHLSAVGAKAYGRRAAAAVAAILAAA